MFFKWLTKKPKPHHILENVAPGLITCLEILSPDQRSRLLRKAFELTVRSMPKIESDIQMLLQIGLEDSVFSGDQMRMIRALAESADEKHFELEEQNPGSKTGEYWFDNARLATALGDAYGDSSAVGAADAIYELSVIPDDASELFALVKSELVKLKTSDLTT